mgnify:CR=1 FL=1
MHANVYPVEKMCKILNVSSSGYYYWCNHPIPKRVIRNTSLLSEIKKVYHGSKEIYGAPRITQELNMAGISTSQKTVARLMRENNIKSKLKRKFKITTDSNHKYPISPNLINQNFMVARKAQVWVSDITYIKTGRGWLYLTIILDLFDRKIIGWSMSDRMNANLTILPAWEMACKNRLINQELIFHSDRGVQYASDRFRKRLRAYPLVRQSMSRKGNCWDNAVAESFFKSLKVEAVYPYCFRDKNEAKLAVFKYIEAWYNQNRRHSHLGGLTMNEFEKFNHVYYVA